MVQKNRAAGFALAVFTILVWGSTFVSTKALLSSFSPFEVIVIRYFLGYLCLWAMFPRPLRLREKKHELLFAAAGFSGLTLYQFLENTALYYTQASNVSIIVSTAPLFCAVLVSLFPNTGAGRSRIGPSFLAGFAAAIVGIALVSYNGATELHLNPAGDILALVTALVWGVYSAILGKINALQYPIIAATRRMFFYALIFMIPLGAFTGITTDASINAVRFANPVNIFNLLFLGVFASALCFAAWSKASKVLGIIETSTFIYLGPVITVIAAVIFLGERVTALTIAGMLLTIAGLTISEWAPRRGKG
jgi:drug/metabolite transporter (DMT)-like permease